MDTDDAVDIIRDMDEEKQEEVLAHIKDIEQAGDIVDLLQYDEDTAGGLMSTEMVVVNENWSMPECLKEMRSQAEDMDEIYYIYVVDDDERLCGLFPLKKMVTSPSVSKVKHVMSTDVVSVDVDTPIDEVTMLIEKYNLVAIPVVDKINRLVGQITVDDVMDGCVSRPSTTSSSPPVLPRTSRATTPFSSRQARACPGCLWECWEVSVHQCFLTVSTAPWGHTPKWRSSSRCSPVWVVTWVRNRRP